MSALPQVLPAEPPIVAAASLLQVIERAATNPAVDIDKMERLMAMYERHQAREAEAAFNEALKDCQSECGRIAADAENPQTRSSYATYAALDRKLRPIYTKHGLSISYDTEEAKTPDCVTVLAYVSKGSHTRTYRVTMPSDGKGAKGGDVMTKTHATGAAVSYGMRYLLKAIFNVAVGEEDQDGNTEGMGEIERDKWAAKIEATTTKDKAKEVMAEVAKVCEATKDHRSYEAIKVSYQAHIKFIEKAAK